MHDRRTKRSLGQDGITLHRPVNPTKQSQAWLSPEPRQSNTSSPSEIAFAVERALQEDELVGLRAANEDLRRHLTLIRDHYLGLATGVVTELDQIDHLFQAALQSSRDVTNEPDDSSLISLAERLSPNGERANRAMDAH